MISLASYMHGSVGAAILVTLGTFAGALPARAQIAAPASTFRLDYDATPSDCPAREDVELRFAERLGRDPFSDSAGDSLAIRVVRRGPALEGSIRLIDATGATIASRNITPRTRACASLVDALATVATIWLEPGGLEEQQRGSILPDSEVPTNVVESAPEAIPTSEPPLAPDSPEATPASPQESRELAYSASSSAAPAAEHRSSFVRAAVGVGFGGISQPTLRGSVGGGLDVGPWSVGVDAAFDRRPARDPYRLYRFSALLSACWSRGAWRVCTGPEVQVARVGDERARPLDGRLAYPVGWLSRVELGWSVRRSTYGIVVEPSIWMTRLGVDSPNSHVSDARWSIRIGFVYRRATGARAATESR